MYVEKLTLKNYRGIRDLTIDFDRRLNVFVGDNGCGKTTILDAIVKGLGGARYPLTAGVERSNLQSVLSIPFLDIMIGQDFAKFDLEFSREGKKASVSSGSMPEHISSDLGSKFKRVDYLEILHFPADRGNGLFDTPPSNDLSNRLQTIDPKLRKIVDVNSMYSYALAWVREEENKENLRFRKHVKAKKNVELFEENQKLNAIKNVVAKVTGFSDFTYNSESYSFEMSKVNGVDNTLLAFNQLSLGEQVFVGLLVTIAFYATLNSTENAPTGGSYLFLIDEIELHLHPKWQRKIIPALLNNFPNCQFIITTHSPQVLGEVSAQHIHVLKRNDDGDIVCSRPERSKGLSSSEVLTEVMGQVAMNEELLGNLDKIYTWIEKEDFEEAQELLSQCEATYGELPSLLKARTVLDYSMPELA